MELKHPNQNQNNIKKSKIIDCFWDDCIKQRLPNNNMKSKISSNTNIINSFYKNNKKSNYKHILLDRLKVYKRDMHLKQLNKRKPISSKIQNLPKKERINNSIRRSILLYSYGLEVKKAKITNISQNKIKREKEELKLCTWRPKINNYKFKLSKNKNLGDYNTHKIIEKKTNDIININDYSFHPKINEKSSLKKVFNKKRSISLYTDRENSSFILRYRKARDEYMLTRFKKLSEKDDSYLTSYIDLTTRIQDQENQNVANCNSLIINDNILKRNSTLISIPSNNINIVNDNQDSNKSKSKGYYLNLLKKQLRLINLEI